MSAEKRSEQKMSAHRRGAGIDASIDEGEGKMSEVRGGGGLAKRMVTLETQVSTDLAHGIEWVREATGRASQSEVLRDSAELAHMIVHIMVERGARLFIGEKRDQAVQILIPHLERAAGRLRKRANVGAPASSGTADAPMPAAGVSGALAPAPATRVAASTRTDPTDPYSRWTAGLGPAPAPSNRSGASIRRTTLLVFEGEVAMSTTHVVYAVTRVIPRAKRGSITASLHGFKSIGYVRVHSKTPAGLVLYAITPAGRRWLLSTRPVVASDPVSGSPR